MKNNEKFWKTAEIIFGAIGAALLVVILVLRLLSKDVTAFAYAIVGVVILFLISDEFARSIRRRREKEEAAREREAHPEENAPEPTLPPEAFDFSEKDEKQP
jgi:flagellar biosynthesis/type III secretory pathway M-ring protein FliF/YscJ